MDNFKINGTVIDFGTAGRFGPGRESALRKYLNSRDDGDKMFSSLVKRQAIVINNADPVTDDEVETISAGEKVIPDRSDKDVQDEIIDGEESGEPQEGETGEEMEEAETAEERKPDYEPTGKYEFDHYGGGNCHIIDPDGFIIEQMRKKEKASEYVDNLNSEL